MYQTTMDPAIAALPAFTMSKHIMTALYKNQVVESLQNPEPYDTAVMACEAIRQHRWLLLGFQGAAVTLSSGAQYIPPVKGLRVKPWYVYQAINRKEAAEFIYLKFYNPDVVPSWAWKPLKTGEGELQENGRLSINGRLVRFGADWEARHDHITSIGLGKEYAVTPIVEGEKHYLYPITWDGHLCQHPLTIVNDVVLLDSGRWARQPLDEIFAQPEPTPVRYITQ